MRRQGVLVLLLAVAVAAAGLAVPSPAAEAGVNTPCVDRPFASAGTTTVNLTHNSRSRSYLLHVPQGYSPLNRYPVVFNFHGAGRDAAEQLAYTGYVPFADQHGIIVVAPQADPALGYWAPWNQTVDDVGLVSKIIDQVKANYCVDGDRVFSTGLSSGGIMTSYLACRLGTRFAAVVTVAGTIQPGSCHPGRPVPEMAFHGTADPVIRYNGGGTVTGIPVPPVKPEVGTWARRNGCGTSTVTRIAPDVVERRWRCAANQMTKLVRIEGGGHVWPGADLDVGLGPATQSVDATAKGWNFFENHPRA